MEERIAKLEAIVANMQKFFGQAFEPPAAEPEGIPANVAVPGAVVNEPANVADPQTAAPAAFPGTAQ